MKRFHAWLCRHGFHWMQKYDELQDGTSVYQCKWCGRSK